MSHLTEKEAKVMTSNLSKVTQFLSGTAKSRHSYSITAPVHSIAVQC
jgi:hypothetical protein